MLATRFPFTSKGKKVYEISNGHLFVPLINLSVWIDSHEKLWSFGQRHNDVVPQFLPLSIKWWSRSRSFFHLPNALHRVKEVNLPLSMPGRRIINKQRGGASVKNTTVVEILFIALTMTICFGRAWPCSGHKLSYKLQGENVYLYMKDTN
jgi:hypothetical protein